MVFAPLTFSEAKAKIERSRYGSPKIQNNTYLHWMPDGNSIGVRLHSTDVVIIHNDHTFTLNSGGWETVTTQSRINSWSPARVGSAYDRHVSGWVIQTDASDTLTEPRVQKCRVCKGKGTIHHEDYWRTYGQRDGWETSIESIYVHTDGSFGTPSGYGGEPYPSGDRRECSRWYACDISLDAHERIDYMGAKVRGYGTLDTPELVTPAHDTSCWQCGQSDTPGRFDYGSKPRHAEFYSGVRVNGDGKVIDDPTYVPETKSDREARIAREDKARKAADRRGARAKREDKRKWFAALETHNGLSVVYKAVDDGLMSRHNFHYPIGEMVTAPDWNTSATCAGGLFFCASPIDASAYQHSESLRFLACAVRKNDSVVVHGDKIKAKRALVLWEVCEHGRREGRHHYDGLVCPSWWRSHPYT